MKELKYLAKNTGLLVIGQFGTKLLSFFLVPLYTYVLTTAEYGTFDLLTTTVSLLVPIFTLNICDSALRFPLDSKIDRSEIFSICIFHFFSCVILGTILISINYIGGFIPIINDYPILFLMMFASTAINGIMSCFARGIDCVKEVAISGVICSVVIICFNLLFLLPLHMGLYGFFLANILGIISQSFYLFVAIRGWKFIKWKHLDSKLHNEMLDFSKPMILTNISWWVNGVSNRYIITWLNGIAANGIYSVSYKIPSIFMMLQNIFSQAWTLSAVQEFDKEDKNGFFSKLYSSYNVGMTIICSGLIILSRTIAGLLYSNDFYSAWRCAPFLLIAAVWGALSGYIGGIYTATKDTKAFAKTSTVGAVVNLVLTLLLVWKIGILGAAIASSISYGIVWVMRIRTIKKYMNLRLSLFNDCLGYLILFIQTGLLFVMEDCLLFFVLEILFASMILIINRSLLKILVSKICRKILVR
ncbi:lipopolysaccharide biosynthesis protein [Phocaeicola sp.]